MSDFDASGSFQHAFDQIDALAKAATDAVTATGTVESDLMTITMTAVPQIAALDYTWAAFRGVGSEALADATRAAVADALVKVQAAQAEKLRSMPALAALLDATPTSMADLPPEVAERARVAAAALMEQEFTAADDAGRVEVSVDGAGAITRLWLSATAGRESSSEWLADSVRSTINAAMTQARRAQEGLFADDDSADLERELDAIVGAHEVRLEALTSKLDDLARRLDLD